LIENGELLNSAMVLFGQRDRLQFRFPQCMVRMARFRGITKTEFIDNRQLAGNAFEIYRQAQQFWIDHLPVASRILPNVFERQDDPLYPTEALREALVNAICHRDYAIFGGAIDIAIYDDRMEIVSPGPLRFGLTTETLRQPHASLKLNPRIANAFYLRGIIESWGRGTLRMMELTTASGLPEPQFVNSNHSFTVQFLPSKYMAPSRVEADLTHLQQDILQIVGASGLVSLSQIREALRSSPSERAVQENLRVLRSLGLVDMEGSRRWARWSLKR
jgi:ATP-dependent DNA helicase RecG